METQFEALAAEALHLAASERAALAQLMLASLDDETEIDDAWALEVERRVAELESGASAVISLDEALARVRAAMK